MVDKVIIKNLRARGIIGVNDWEREKPQEILINIEIFSDLMAAGKSDDLTDSVNYRTIAKAALRAAETLERFTVEALAEDISAICLLEAHVLGVRVKVEKPGAVRFSDSVGVEIERGRVS
jgi:FolB domain-containing protein